jgi:5-formyltetrahydrofolate cyclo-ligase
MESVVEAKKTLRDNARRDRALSPISSDWLHILSASEMNNAGTVATYISYGDEPNTQVLNKKLLELGKRLLVPKTQPDLSIKWVEWSGQEEVLKKNSFFKKMKVLEPEGPAIDPSEIDVAIIPALLIDIKGMRLGQGGGSYDRALATLNAWKVALIYSHELMAHDLPHESHDKGVDAAATPSTLIRFI